MSSIELIRMMAKMDSSFKGIDQHYNEGNVAANELFGILNVGLPNHVMATIHVAGVVRKIYVHHKSSTDNYTNDYIFSIIPAEAPTDANGKVTEYHWEIFGKGIDDVARMPQLEVLEFINNIIV